jgi:hypothetical protein
MEFPFDEADDIILEQYTTDVADEDPDPIRARGSVHRGAAYLQEMSYPPGGASSGQEGGSMRPVEEIEVFGDEMDDFDDAFNYTDKLVRAQHIEALEGEDDGADELANVMADLLNDEMASAMLRQPEPPAPAPAAKPPIAVVGNLGDSSNAYCHGLDVLGAGTQMMSKAKVPPRMGSVLRSVPNGNKYLSKQVGTVKVGDYKSSLRNAQSMGQHAIDTGNRLLAVLKKRASEPKKATKVHGLVTSAKRPGPGKKLVRVTPAQATKMAKAAKDSGTKALASAKKFAGVLDANVAKQAAARQALSAKISTVKVFRNASTVAKPPAVVATKGAVATKRVATQLRGEYLDNMSDFLGAYADTLSEELACDMLLGDDDMLGEGEAPADQAPSDPNASVTVDDSDLEFMNPGAKPTAAPPAEPNVDYVPDPYPGQSWNDPTGYTELPKGAFWFDNSPSIQSLGEPKADPWNGGTSLGSANRFREYPGITFSNPVVTRTDNSGMDYSKDGWQFYEPKSRYSGFSPVEDTKGYNRISQNQGWGPIIGRPNSPFSGLRFVDDGSSTGMQGMGLFFFYDTAPAHYRQAGDTERLNQALADWHTAKAAYDAEIAARALAAFLEAEEAKALLKKNAKEDEADTRRQSKESTEAEHKAAVADTAAQQELKTTKEFEAAATEEEEKRGKIEEERYARTSEQDVALTERLSEKEAALADQRAEKEAALAEQAAQADYERYMSLAAQEGAAPSVPEAEDLDSSQSVFVQTPSDEGNLAEYADLAPADEGEAGSYGEGFENAEGGQGEGFESAESVLGDVIPNYRRGSDRLRMKRQDR